jgi:hypothetical protein
MLVCAAIRVRVALGFRLVPPQPRQELLRCDRRRWTLDGDPVIGNLITNLPARLPGVRVAVEKFI